MPSTSSAQDLVSDTADVPTWPVYDLTVHEDGRIVTSGPLIPLTGHPTRAAAVDAVAAAASRLGRPVRARAIEPDGNVWQLIIAPDGEVREAPGEGPPSPRAAAPKKARAKRQEQAAAPAPTARASEPPVARAAPARTREEPASYEGELARVRALMEAGRADEATALAVELDERAAGVLGVSHPDALRIREVLARASAAAGDAVGAIRLYRDVAERWHYKREARRAEEVASRAETLWVRITRVDQALTAGVAMIRMRNQIPGPSGDALTAVLEHWAWLEEQAYGVSSGPYEGAVRGVAEASAPAERESQVRRDEEPRPLSTWERPAVRARSAG
ncbi:hypothetical protein GCM10009801_12440 [Streptomyces albiaxialis]|uniref:Tetratricopeptide repeat protein n=1 Tax=Streptomyces albiaxialis TaxID=329523 RepID=A0ABN2VMP5_9ACTN